MLRASLLLACLALLGGGLAFPAQAPAAGGWGWPVAGEVLTHYRNGSDPYAAGQHRGVDIAAPAGTRVVAAAGGTVRFAGVAGASGLTVSVRTADGRFDTSYLHLSEAAVSEGDPVAVGEPIGAVGTSGRRSAEAPHLHFGVREAATRHAYVDPLTLLGPPPRPAPPEPPRVAPAPVPAPVLPAISPVPAPGLARLPAVRPLRPAAGSRARAALPALAPAPVPAPSPGLSPLPALAGAGRQAGRDATAAENPPVPSLGPRAPGVPAPRPAAPPTPARPRPRAGGHGPDVGWALACAGLLLAAGLMGAARGAPGRRRRALHPRGGLAAAPGRLAARR